MFIIAPWKWSQETFPAMDRNNGAISGKPPISIVIKHSSEENWGNFLWGNTCARVT
jgi:hypothetical protein